MKKTFCDVCKNEIDVVAGDSLGFYEGNCEYVIGMQWNSGQTIGNTSGVRVNLKLAIYKHENENMFVGDIALCHKHAAELAKKIIDEYEERLECKEG